MNLKHALAGITLLCGVVAAAQADTFDYSGDTTGAPVFNRPITPDLLSSIGTAVHYDMLSFSVDVAGVYSFVSQSDVFDVYTLLYANSFTPAASTSNLINVNDDVNGEASVSGFLSYLDANTPYVFVTTGFQNSDFGKFNATVSGEGHILTGPVTAPVPEPATYGMLLAGLGLLGVLRKRHS